MDLKETAVKAGIGALATVVVGGLGYLGYKLFKGEDESLEVNPEEESSVVKEDDSNDSGSEDSSENSSENEVTGDQSPDEDDGEEVPEVKEDSSDEHKDESEDNSGSSDESSSEESKVEEERSQSIDPDMIKRLAEVIESVKQVTRVNSERMDLEVKRIYATHEREKQEIINSLTDELAKTIPNLVKDIVKDEIKKNGMQKPRYPRANANHQKYQQKKQVEVNKGYPREKPLITHPELAFLNRIGIDVSADTKKLNDRKPKKHKHFPRNTIADHLGEENVIALKTALSGNIEVPFEEIVDETRKRVDTFVSANAVQMQ